MRWFYYNGGRTFTDMEDAMSFQDFFALIGVDDYEYFEKTR